MSGAHASFAPSSAHRVATCPASLLQTKDLPDNVSFEAVEGTVAHYIHEQCLLHKIPASNFTGMSPHQFMDREELTNDEWSLLPWSRLGADNDFLVTDEMAAYVQESVDFCAGHGGEQFIEQRVNISRYTPIDDQFGTCDFAAITEDDVLHIIDLKYGKGVKVFAERNLQLVMYALGFIEEHDLFYSFDRVCITISQPRLDHRDTWETTADELRSIGRGLLERFTLALKPDAPFGPEEHACKFCKLKPVCPALAERAKQLALTMFDEIKEDIALPAPERDWPLSAHDVKPMTPTQLAVILDNAKLIQGFLTAAEAHAVHLLMHDTDVPGYKLVEGRSNRAWGGDDEEIVSFLETAGVEDTRKPAPVISVADAEKALKKLKAFKNEEISARFAALVTKPKGKPTLAPVSDKREAYSLKAGDMFDAVDENDNL